jgi:predicted nucleic acid-binding protein
MSSVSLDRGGVAGARRTSGKSMAYLFDTDALSEVMRKKPLMPYLAWLRRIPREEQYTSAVTVGELYQGAFRSPHRDRLLRRIDEVLLPEITVLPYDVGVARVFGEIRADLERVGALPGDADLQIAATALRHDLALVTGNLRHHERVPGLKIERILAQARATR